MDFRDLFELPDPESGSFLYELEQAFGGDFSWVFIVLILLTALNVFAFLLYGLDKWKARHKRWRIPEAVLLGVAALFAAAGAYFAMRLFRHKTQHIKFYVGVPLMLGFQIILIVYLFLCVA